MKRSFWVGKNFREYVEGNLDAIVVVDRRGALVYANRSFASLTGFSSEELRAREFAVREFFPAARWDMIASRLGEGERSPAHRSRYELDLLHKTGEKISVEMALYSSLSNSEPVLLLILRDISSIVAAQEKMIEDALCFQSIAKGAFDGLILMNVDGCCIYANPALARMTGYTETELPGLSFRVLVHASDLERQKQRFERRLKGLAVPSVYEVLIARKDGSSLPVEVSIGEIMWKCERAFVGLFKDVSERKRLERDLLRSAETERARIGMELHDTVGQQLVGVTYLAETLARKQGKAGSGNVAALREIIEECRLAHQNLREIVQDLLPLHQQEGLAVTLRRLCRQIEKWRKISCRLLVAGAADGIGRSQTQHLHQIAREAIGNAFRHGRARNIAIRLDVRGRKGLLRIDDDGCGFDVENVRSEGSGLRSMRYRANMLRGSLEIARRASGGMSVRCVFQVAAEPPEGDAVPDFM